MLLAANTFVYEVGKVPWLKMFESIFGNLGSLHCWNGDGIG